MLTERPYLHLHLYKSQIWLYYLIAISWWEKYKGKYLNFFTWEDGIFNRKKKNDDITLDYMLWILSKRKIKL